MRLTDRNLIEKLPNQEMRQFSSHETEKRGENYILKSLSPNLINYGKKERDKESYEILGRCHFNIFLTSLNYFSGEKLMRQKNKKNTDHQ